MKQHGTVNTYDIFKGMGFIRREKGKDVFFHYTSLICDDSLISEGDKVSFDVKKTGKGLKAVNVDKIG